VKINQFPETEAEAQTIFLGGSTASGKWQQDFAQFMADTDVTLINTSRPDWKNKILSLNDISEHVAWEMLRMNRADFIFIHIDKEAKSPTVLLELGIAITAHHRQVVVYLEEGYSHWTNAATACETAGIPFFVLQETAMKRMKDMYLNLSRL